MNVTKTYLFILYAIFLMLDQVNTAKTTKSQEEMLLNDINKAGYKQTTVDNSNFIPTPNIVISI